MRARHSPPAPGMFIRCRARGWRLRWRPLRVLARHGGTDAIGPRCWLGCQPIQLPNRREHAAASAARTRAREAKPALSAAAPSSMRDGCDLAQGGERPWPRRPVPAEQTSECAQRAGGMRKVWWCGKRHRRAHLGPDDGCRRRRRLSSKRLAPPASFHREEAALLRRSAPRPWAHVKIKSSGTQPALSKLGVAVDVMGPERTHLNGCEGRKFSASLTLEALGAAPS